MKIKFILAAILIAGAVLGCWLIKYQYDKINTLEKQKNELEQTLEKARKANVEANNQIKKLRQLKATDNESANWLDIRIPDNIIMQLQERYSTDN